MGSYIREDAPGILYPMAWANLLLPTWDLLCSQPAGSTGDGTVLTKGHSGLLWPDEVLVLARRLHQPKGVRFREDQGWGQFSSTCPANTELPVQGSGAGI